MTKSEQIAVELSDRIRAEVAHFSGAMPERTALAWRGYLAAMLEWHLVGIAQYEELIAKIPEVRDDPAVYILRGRG